MKLILGNMEFDQRQLEQVRLRQQIDPVLGKLQPHTMTVRLRSPGSLQRIAQEQVVAQLYSDQQLLATQYMTSCTQNGMVQTIQCRSETEYLDVEFPGAVYDGADLPTVVDEILDGWDCHWDAGLLQQVSGHVPICTRRQALNMLSIAQGGCMNIRNDGSLWLEKLSAENPRRLEKSQIISQPVMVSLPGYRRVELATHRYVAGSQWVVVFQNRQMGEGEQTMTFDEPVYRYWIKNGTIRSSNCNRVTFLPEDPEELQILPYLHSQEGWLAMTSDMVSTTQNRVLSIRDNTLVGQHNRELLIESLQEKALFCHRLQMNIRVDGETVGQAVEVDTPWNTCFRGYITCMDSTLTVGSHRALITIAGRET